MIDLAHDQPDLGDPELARARFLLHQLYTEPADVLLFGESTLTYVGAHEADDRSVADLVAEKLQPLKTYTHAGPGYGAPLHTECVRLASALPPRPVIVHSLWVRGTFPAFRLHPIYGYVQAIERLRRLSTFDRIYAPYEPATPADFLAYEDLPYPTLRGDRTILDFMVTLRHHPSPETLEHAQAMFEFHWGGVPEEVGLRAFTALGRTLRESGYPVVAFQNPVNVVEGSQVLGAEFTDWHARNQQLVLEAYREGAGEHAVVLETGMLWQPEDFIDPALEHLGAEARNRLADLIVTEVRTIGRR